MINNRFKILRKIGEGRSSVYLCTDLRSEYYYALKITSPSMPDEEFDKFADEYYTIQKLNHPGIIKAYESGTVFESSREDVTAGSRYILLEYFDGVELSEMKDIPEDQLREIIIQTASVLQYLHQSYYIYYDLKPENILVSQADGELLIKVIDFGFARITNGEEKTTRGTAEYIAPELLKNETHDHRVDFYSFGILLYKLIYGSFPFDNSSEIKIFRAQLEDNFRFPENKYSPEINNIVRKLLQKDPELRYHYTMQIYNDLSYTPSSEILTSWIPSSRFSGRRDILNILGSYLVNYSGGDVFVIKGSEGSGKTALLSQFTEINPGTIYLDNAKVRFGLDYINDLLEKVLYSESIYRNLSPQLRDTIKNFRTVSHGNIINEVKGIFSRIIRTCKFILAVDDFNFLDELSVELFREIIPLFQVHNIKLIITENSDRPYISDFIHNQHQLNLSPFTDAQLQEYIDTTFYNYYPKNELKKTILLYTDLLPGNIESFIKDLILSGIIRYAEDRISLVCNDETIAILRESHDYFFRMRIESLTPDELYLAQFLSVFQNIPEKKFLAEIFNKPEALSEPLLISLKNKNILHISGDLKNISFTSAGMQEYVYNIIADKTEFHLNIASILEEHSPYNHKEIAYQYESAGEFKLSIDYYRLMYEEACRIEAYNYQRTLLEHIIQFPVADEDKHRLKFELCKVLHKSGDNAAALELCNELMLFSSDTEFLNELLLLRGLCLIESGEPAEGIKQIEHLVEILEDEKRRHSLQIELASAHLDINNFSEAENICRDIIKSSGPDNEITARCNNLLGIISIHRDNDFDAAYDYFLSAEQIYTTAGVKFGTAKMQLNLGNIKAHKDEPDEAEALFKSSLELNSSIGNLKHEANLLLNIGIIYLEKLNYDKSVEYYKRALSIYSHTGDLRGEGWVTSNLGEIYFLTCDYRNALLHIKEARSIFQRLKDKNEELEALFLMGKIYHELGSSSKVEKIIIDYEAQLSNQGAKHEYNYRFLKVLAKKKSLNFFHEIKDIIHYYSAQGDKKNYFRASMTAVKFLYDHQLFKEALEQISSSELGAAAKQNNYFEAEWNLCYGLIICNTGYDEVHPNEYYLKAYKIVEELSISEITWKIMITLADFYYKRGNALKAEEFAYYTRNILEYISDHIGDESLVRSYNERQEAKDAITLCSIILKGNG